jgi:hypothetical protein
MDYIFKLFLEVQEQPLNRWNIKLLVYKEHTANDQTNLASNAMTGKILGSTFQHSTGSGLACAKRVETQKPRNSPFSKKS